jgi:hypothetical protein
MMPVGNHSEIAIGGDRTSLRGQARCWNENGGNLRLCTCLTRFMVL